MMIPSSLPFHVGPGIKMVLADEQRYNDGGGDSFVRSYTHLPVTYLPQGEI